MSWNGFVCVMMQTDRGRLLDSLFLHVSGVGGVKGLRCRVVVFQCLEGHRNPSPLRVCPV